MKTKNSTTNLAIRVSIVTILWNVVLSAFKLIAGILSGSGAMISDAIHSASDVFSTFIVIIGIKISAKDSDKEHPYGHERLECVAAILLAVILCATGIGIGYAGLRKIFSGTPGELTIPGTMALIAAIISIVVKEAMYWYTHAAARKINSGALMADAWHHRSDALSSVGSFVGILGARLGLPILDPIASVVICLFVVKAAVDIFLDAIGKMTDKSCDESLITAIREAILKQDGILGIDEIKTRQFGNRIYVDIDIRVDGTQPLCDAHTIAHSAHDIVETQFPLVKHCMIHLNPND